VNTRNAPFADAICVFSKLNVYIQEKRVTSALDKNIHGGRCVHPNNKAVVKEFEKIGKAFKKDDIFLYITDCNEQNALQKRKDDTKLPDRCYVICQEKFPEVFGDTMCALRLHSVAYDDIDVTDHQSTCKINKKRKRSEEEW
jgi:hypothetical protein